MTQPQNPSPSYYPQQPSAASAPMAGQPGYAQQPSAASAPMAGQAGYPQQASASMASQPGQASPSYAQQPSAPMAGQPAQGYQGQAAATGDSFFSSLFDTSKAFATRYGNIVFIVAMAAICIRWLYEAYVTGNTMRTYNGSMDGTLDFNTTEFLLKLVLEAPLHLTFIFLVRLLVELVRGSSRSGSAS